MVTGVVLPLGISFYSFEAVSYLFDSQQGRVSSTSFLDLALFIMFWPHLIAGPIVRVRELVPQLKFDRKFEIGFVLQGLDRVVWGLVQKNVFANSIGPWVDNGFVPGAAPLNTALDNWFLAAAFGLQIYFDFAAYTNIAIGSAQLIGVKLPENFRYPYHAVTPPEFWSRWHMTLSRWIRDYLFFPLNARYKGSPVSVYLSLVAAMAVVRLHSSSTRAREAPLSSKDGERFSAWASRPSPLAAGVAVSVIAALLYGGPWGRARFTRKFPR